MKLAINDLGERFLQYRKALGLRQTDVAEKVDLNQNQISRLETGLGGTLESALDLINFYSDHFHLAPLLSDDFEVIKKSEAVMHLNTYNSIAVERLKLLKDEFGDKLTDIINIIEKEEAI